MFNKGFFDEKMQRFIDAGYVNEIYSDDLLSIFNFADLFYVGCYHRLWDNVPIGMILTDVGVEKVVADPYYLNAIMDIRNSRGEFQKYSIPFNDFSFNKMPEMIKKWSESGKYNYINLDMEKRINQTEGEVF